MKTSESVNEVQKALSEFKKDMPPVKRANDVKMKGTSKAGKEYEVSYEYAPLELIQEQARPHLTKNGLFLTQQLGHFTLGNDIISTITTRICHSSGQFIESVWPIDLAGIQKEQDRGSKITYNKRYAYTAALDIALWDEDNDAQGVPLPATKKEPIKKTEFKKDPYYFVDGRFKGKKFSEVEPSAFMTFLSDCDAVEKKSPNLMDLISRMKNYVTEQNNAASKELDERLGINATVQG